MIVQKGRGEEANQGNEAAIGDSPERAAQERAEHDRNRGPENHTGQRTVKIGNGRTPHKYERGVNQGRNREGNRTREGRRGATQPRQPTERSRATRKEERNKAQSREANKRRKGEEERDVGGYTLDTSLVRGVGALRTWFEPRAVEQFMCDKGILTDCQLHRCLQLVYTIAKVHMSATFCPRDPD